METLYQDLQSVALFSLRAMRCLILTADRFQGSAQQWPWPAVSRPQNQRSNGNFVPSNGNIYPVTYTMVNLDGQVKVRQRDR